MSLAYAPLNIGPVYARLIREVGVDTVSLLGQQDPIELHSRLFAQSLEIRCIPPTLSRVQCWIRAAKRASTTQAVGQAV